MRTWIQRLRRSLTRPTSPRPARGAGRPALEELESRTLLSAATPFVKPAPTTGRAAAYFAGPGGYSPAQVRHAYGLDAVTTFYAANGQAAAANGSGQTIAIVDAYNDPGIVNDLAVFDQQFGLAAPPRFSVINQNGGTALPTAADPTGGTWALETALDVEWAHALAPGANILLVEANSNSGGDLFAAVNTARNQTGVTVVSMSFGGSEFVGENTLDGTFTTPAGHLGGSNGLGGPNLAGGVTFVAAAGDSPGTTYPSASPNVLSVGGTTLTLADALGDTDPTHWESAWGQSGGGFSTIENRSVPDVSYNADPNTPFAIYNSVPFQGRSGWQGVAGTSAGAPQWAALVAVADQGRAVTAGLGSLDGPSQVLPALRSSLSATHFRAIGGGNTGRGSPTGDLVYDVAVPNQTASQRQVGHLYLDLLHRTPDPAGLSGWTSALNSGTSINAVAQAFVNSTEYRQDLVRSWYLEYLGRPADPSGLNFWTSQLAAGMSDEQVQAYILGSAESYQDSGASNAGFVTNLYAKLLDRAPDASGLAAWVGMLNGGTSPVTVALAFLTSTEYRTDLVSSYYQGILHRQADPGGLNYWVGSLSAGTSDESVVAAFASTAAQLY
jgi:hypothetical protein